MGGVDQISDLPGLMAEVTSMASRLARVLLTYLSCVAGSPTTYHS
jgi:hypothetical protein